MSQALKTAVSSLDSVPKHVAIIMDGNGRWAQRRGHSRVFGHVRGAHRVKGIVKEANRMGVKTLTLFAFSTENWKRPQGELNVLWRLLVKFLRREVDELHRENVKMRVIGEIERLEPRVRAVVEQSLKRLNDNTGLELVFALSYGSRAEIQRATQDFARDCVAGVHKPEDLNEELLESYYWTREMPDVDLMIRTSGEKRISNFLLWQSAYAELYFSDLCWPEFMPEQFKKAIESFAGRERRFGSVSV